MIIMFHANEQQPNDQRRKGANQQLQKPGGCKRRKGNYKISIRKTATNNIQSNCKILELDTTNCYNHYYLLYIYIIQYGTRTILFTFFWKLIATRRHFSIGFPATCGRFTVFSAQVQ